ncbi:MarR family winged helix-turn-helix transcriptional regulator [Paraburkholderia sp. J63]|uniref:MarR family winged helix-turn-helix transcriptional regulator n=1 Tax=Paraburkholderia sp. J63 TaxID=2805434 RepID=UPI002ABDF6E0|nr:MarR family transcriptional regulator [Paraburkholderia sp. J63]
MKTPSVWNMSRAKEKTSIESGIRTGRQGMDANPRQRGRPIRLTYLVGQLDRLVKRRLTEVLSQIGLTLPQYTALSVLNARGQLTNAQLAERSFITPQSANEVVKIMEANGWVAREGHPTHGRLIHLSLTSEGLSRLGECDVAIDEVESAMLRGLDQIPEESLRDILQACVGNLRAL